MSRLYVIVNRNEVYFNLSVNLNEPRLQKLTEVMQNLLGLEFNMDVSFDSNYEEVNFYFLTKKLHPKVFQALEEEYIIKYFEAILTLFEIEDN